MEIKGFKILEEIHRGPVTTVFKAKQISLDRNVLLKVLNIQWKSDLELVERFKREAKICAKLQHPNIVNIYDFGTCEDECYITMEFVHGQTLQELLRKKSPLPVPVILYIAKSILQGLDYAHRFGVIHRDIKPSNIMIENNGSIKITDFGLATIHDLPNITNQGNIVGTPAYMSPEQVLSKPLDARSDLFSYGCLLYEMCTGIAPFQDEHVAAIINKTLNVKPNKVHTIRAEIPEWFSNLIDHLLKKEVADRPLSAQKVLHELNAQSMITNEGFLDYLNGSSLSAKLQGDKIIVKPRLPRRMLIPGILVFLFILTASLYLGLSKDDSSLPTLESERLVSEQNPINEPPREESTMITNAVGKADSGNNFIVNIMEINTLPEKIENKKSAESKLFEEKINVNSGLYVFAHPWAEIWVDNQFRETTPLSSMIEFSAGIHEIELKNPGYEPFRLKMNFAPTQPETLNVRLKPLYGFLDIHAVPWAKIIIDDQFEETTPLAEPMPLMPGEYLLRIENPNFKSITDTIYISAGVTLKKQYILKE